MKRELFFQEVFLFSSVVTGNNHKYSDIEIAFVSKQFTGNPVKDLNIIIPLVVSNRKFTLFEPHLYTPEDFNDDPFAGVIKKKGVKAVV